MEGEDTDNIIGIGVLPPMTDSRIIDWENLNNTHTRLLSPVDQSLEITEIPHSIAMLTPQGEYGYRDTGGTPGLLFQA